MLSPTAPDREQSVDQSLRRLAVARIRCRPRSGRPPSAVICATRVSEVVERHALAVGLADRIGHRVAADGERGEAGVDGQCRRPRVPHRRQDHRVTRHVQRQQRICARCEIRCPGRSSNLLLDRISDVTAGHVLIGDMASIRCRNVIRDTLQPKEVSLVQHHRTRRTARSDRRPATLRDLAARHATATAPRCAASSTTPNASSTTSICSTSMPKDLDLGRQRAVTHSGEKIGIPDTQYDSDFWRDVDDEGVGGHRQVSRRFAPDALPLSTPDSPSRRRGKPTR